MRLPRWLMPIASPHVGLLSAAAGLALTVIGLAGIDVAVADGSSYPLRQAAFIPIAVGAMLAAALIHPKHLVLLAWPLMVVGVIALVVVILPFMPQSIVPVRNGAQRWFNLGPVLFQPSELVKIIYVLALANWLRFRENHRSIAGLAVPLLITFVPMGLILVEPDLGTAMIFIPVFLSMLVAAGAKLKHMLAIVLIGATLMPAMYPLLRPHQKERIVAMISQVRGETRHRADIGFQGYKAQSLVGAGQLVGQGGEHARSLLRFNRLPERHNDMIFAVVCTRWGFLGGLAVILLYVVFVTGGLLAAALNRSPFERLVATGVVTIVFTQMFVNIGMTVGLLPITGMTLPFVSYGGSSLVANFIMVGLIVNVGSRRPIIVGRRAFEFDRPAEDPVRRSPFADAM